MKNKTLIRFYFYVAIFGALEIEVINFINGHPFGIGLIFYWMPWIFLVIALRRNKENGSS